MTVEAVHEALGRALELRDGRVWSVERRFYDTFDGPLGFRAAAEPLVDEAARAAGGAPGGISSKIDVALTREQRTDTAAAVVLERLLEVMRANLPGTIADVDSEFLHDFRVAV